MEVPKHEQIKRDLANSFTVTSTYAGQFIRDKIMNADFKELKQIQAPEQIKKGDVIIVFEGVKSRPAVICKVLKDKTCIYIPLTSTENVHCLSKSKSRFFGEGCFSKNISVCTEEFAIKQFVGVYDNMELLNNAIRSLKEFINENI